MKAQVLNFIRQGHIRFASRDLPAKLAIYFHELDRHQIPAFREALTYFTDEGYGFASPREFVAAPVDEKLLFVSFDDNFKSWHEALGTMEACRATATFYVNSGMFRDVAPPHVISDFFDRIRYFGDRQTLSRNEVSEISASGHTIGCHTHTHPMLSLLPRDAWDDEILASKHVLEDILGGAVDDFSFPFGMRRHFSPALRDYCADIGFKTIATGISGQQHMTRIDPLEIHRSGWKFDLDLADNIANLKVDSRLYARLSGRSAVG